MSKGNVLIIDDKEENLLLLEAILEPEGFKIFKSLDGRKGIEIAKKEPIDIVILDVLMPDLDGYEVCKILRKDFKLRFVPIIMLTALSGRVNNIKGLEAGADDFISKPVDDDLLIAKVKSLVNLKKSRDEVEKLRNELSSMIVHDLKTPVHSILSCCELIKEEEVSEKVLKYVSLIEKSGDKLKKMISRFLDMAKIESGKLSLNLEKVNIVDVINMLIEEFDSIAKEKKVSFIFDTEDLKSPLYLILDVEKIEEAFSNIIQNSFKFTPSGGEVKIHLEKDDDKVLIKFSDTGPGVPENLREKIFDKFVKTLDSKGGSGLGLYITKGIVEAHGGKIYLDKSYKNGTLIVVELPIS